jgi:hypothetical protein
MPEWILPILTPAGVITAAFIAVYGYGRQKRLELDKGLIELRRSMYREFISLVPQLSDGTEKTRAAYLKLISEMNVVATDHVMITIGKFKKYMSDKQPEGLDNAVIKSHLAEVVLAMRKDCFSESRLDVETTKTLLPLV